MTSIKLAISGDGKIHDAINLKCDRAAITQNTTLHSDTSANEDNSFRNNIH